MQGPARLDDLDRKILDHLERDGRATLADVGTAVGLSSSAVKRRVDRLQETGVIVGYAVIALGSSNWMCEALRTSPAGLARVF